MIGNQPVSNHENNNRKFRIELISFQKRNERVLSLCIIVIRSIIKKCIHMIFIQHFSNCRHRNPSFNHHKRGPQMTLAHVSNKLIVSCLPFRACICWKRLFCPWMNLFRFSIHKNEMRFLEASLSRLDCLTVNKGFFSEVWILFHAKHKNHF